MLLDGGLRLRQTTACSCSYPWLILLWATEKGIGFVNRWKGKKWGGLHLGPVRMLPRRAQSRSFTWDLEHIWNRLSNRQCANPLLFCWLQVSPHLHISDSLCLWNLLETLHLVMFLPQLFLLGSPWFSLVLLKTWIQRYPTTYSIKYP